VAVAFGSVGSYPASPFTAAPATSMAVPYPSGIVANEPLLLVALNNNPSGTTTFTTPGTWLLKESGTAINNDLSAYVWVKQAVGTESGTLTVTASQSSILAGAIVRYTGAAAASFGDTASAVSASAGTGSPPAGTLSPAPGASDMVVRFYCWSEDSASTGATMTNPGGTWTTRLNLVTNNSSNFNGGLVIADKIAGTDNQTVSTNSKSGGWLVVDVAIKPAATATDKFMPFFV
jgi:hypothetical protein